MLFITTARGAAVAWKLRRVLRQNDLRLAQFYGWAMAGFALTAISYLIRVIYTRHGTVSISGFVFCIGGTLALLAANTIGAQIYRKRRDDRRRR